MPLDQLRPVATEKAEDGALNAYFVVEIRKATRSAAVWRLRFRRWDL